MKHVAALVLALIATSAMAGGTQVPVATCAEAQELVSMIQEGRANGQTEEDLVARIKSEDDISSREEEAALRLVRAIYHGTTDNALFANCVRLASR